MSKQTYFTGSIDQINWYIAQATPIPCSHLSRVSAEMITLNYNELGEGISCGIPFSDNGGIISKILIAIMAPHLLMRFY